MSKNIGSLKLNEKGIFVGNIATFARTLAIALRPVNRENERAPKYEVLARNADGDWVQLGALYEQFMNATGEAFLQGSISDPSIPTFYFAAFMQDDGSYALAWRAPTTRRDMPVGGASDGLGESDDMLPFDGNKPKGRKARHTMTTDEHALA